MEIKKGIGVSPGVVISTAVVLDAEDLVIPKRTVESAQLGQECERLGHAIADAVVERTQLRDEITAKHGREIGGIFDFHLGLLRDKTILKQMLDEIRNQHTTAEYAVSVVMRRLANKFVAMSDRYLAGRVADIHDIEKAVLRSLVGQKRADLQHLDRDVVVIAHDLLPSQTAALDKMHVRGFATDVGGRTSHTAIVARAMSIPAVVGLGDITGLVSGGDTIIIDGTRGMVIVNPDAEQIEQHREYERSQLRLDSELAMLKDLPAESKDGHVVSLQANI